VFEVRTPRRWGAGSDERRMIFDTDQYTGKTDSFVELKTSLSIRGPHDEAKFEKYDFPSLFDRSIDLFDDLTAENCSSSTSSRFFWVSR